MATGAAPSTATTEPIAATPDTGRVTAASAGVTPATAGISPSSSPDAYLQSLLPLLGTAGGIAPEYVTETMDPSGAVNFGTSTTNPNLQPFDLAAASAVDPNTGLMAGGTGLVGEWSPTSGTRDPSLQQYWGQGDKTMSVDQVRAALSDPAWQTYNAIVQQYPDLAGQLVNPDYLAQALAGQSAGMVDPESNLPKFEAQIQDLLLNQPALVAARGGNYVDITQDPTIQAQIAGGESAAQANLDYMNKYGGGGPWTSELGHGVMDILEQPLTKAALIAFSMGSAAGPIAAADTAAEAGTAGAEAGAAGAEAAGAGAAEGAASSAAALTPAESILGTGVAGGIGGGASSVPTALDVALGTGGGTAGAAGAGLGGGAELLSGASSSAPGLTPAEQVLGQNIAGGIGTPAMASAPGLTPAEAALGSNLAGGAPLGAAADFAAAGGAVAPADAMVAAGMDPNAYLTGTAAEAGSPLSVGTTLGMGGDTTDYALSQAISAGAVDPFAPTAPLGEGGLAPSYDMPGGLDTGVGASADIPDITQMPEDYSWLDQPATADTGAVPGESFPPNAAGAGRGVTDPTGDYAEQLRARGLAPPTYGETATPQSAGTWSDVGNLAKSALKWGGIAGTPITGLMGYLGNKKALQSATQQLQASTAPAQQVGTQLLNQYQSGNLPAGQQAQIDQWLQSTKAAIKQQYINAGAPDSTAERAAEAYAGQTAASMNSQQMNQMMQSGLLALGYGAQGTQAAIKAQLQGDQQMMNQITNFMNAYGNILRGSGVFS
jgi:hypothetical protein